MQPVEQAAVKAPALDVAKEGGVVGQPVGLWQRDGLERWFVEHPGSPRGAVSENGCGRLSLVSLPRPRILRRDLPLDYGKGLATPEQARRSLRKALKANARHTARAEDRPTELCLVGQTRSGADYSAQRRHWLRKASGWSAERWPERLSGEEYALFVAPVDPHAARRRRYHPRPAAEPILVQFDLRLAPELALAIGVGVWLHQVAVGQLDAVDLAPPILERYAAGRLLSREVIDHGLDWALPAPALER